MELQDIVRRLRMKQSIKAIKRETGKHRRVIRRVLQLAEQEAWLDAERELPSEHQLQEVYHEQRGDEEGRRHPLDARRDQIEGWRGDGYSFLVIHKLLQERGVEYSETTVRRYIHRHFPPPVRPVMRRETKPGEVMEVDFGHLGLTWDAATRSRRRTWVFSGRLRHSRRAYREVVFNQKQETFFACHMHAFEWFGGVSEKVTPDNLKAAIIVASFEDPLVNRAYRELALHYGFLISPCLPRRPEHKGGVEGDIKYVKRNFLPLFREAQKERGRETPDAGELGEELERWNRESYDLHVVQKVGRTPLELFESEEAQALTPLPMTRWDLVVCKELSVGPDWRVQFEKAFYTVPYRLIGERAGAGQFAGGAHLPRLPGGHRASTRQAVLAGDAAARACPAGVGEVSEHDPCRAGAVGQAPGAVGRAGGAGDLRRPGGRRYAPGACAHQTGRQVHHPAAGGGLSPRDALRHAQLPQRQEHPGP